MKILAIGDFHGKFPKKLMSRIKKEKFDLIVSPGDYCGDEEFAKIFFKYVYGTAKELWEVVGKKKVNQLEKRNFEAGKKIFNQLIKLNKKVIGVTGNWDTTIWNEVGFPRRKEKYSKKFRQEINKSKDIKIIDFRNYNYEGYNFVGYPRSTYPGKLDKYITKKFKDEYGKKALKIFKRIKEDNNKFYKKLKNKFKENNILISHNCPNRTKLDKIKRGPQKSKHYGSWLVKKVIKDLKPILVICGHIHENQGKQKLEKTWIVNPGAACEGKAAIIELDDKKKKIKSVKFLR